MNWIIFLPSQLEKLFEGTLERNMPCEGQADKFLLFNLFGQLYAQQWIRLKVENDMKMEDSADPVMLLKMAEKSC